MINEEYTKSLDNVLLSVRGLRTDFLTSKGAVKAVRGVSFDVKRGSKVGIVGESGSGKTALALSILGLLTPPGQVVDGEIWFDGQELTGLVEAKMGKVRGKQISLIFQDPMTSLNPIMRIGKQIVESIKKHQPRIGRKEAQDRAIKLLQDVEVPHADQRINDYPHQLSGGMRQRVMIAIALANDPELLIADEPTTALDVTTQAQVLDVLERLVESRGAAVILISHNLGIVADFCDEIKVMYAGRIIEESSTNLIFSAPNHPYTESLLRSVPNPRHLEKGLLPTIPGSPPDLISPPPGCAFEPRCQVGNGVEICRNKPPVPVELQSEDGLVISECFFAEERWQKRDKTSGRIS